MNVIVEKADGTLINYVKIADNAISFDTHIGETYVIRNISAVKKIEAPTDFRITHIDKCNYEFSWKGSLGASKYNVYKAIENDSDYTFVGQTSETTYVHTQSDSKKTEE